MARLQQDSRQGKYATAAGRWKGVGPYYAMFPTSFADEVVKTYTAPGDLVLDPFAGRGTAVFAAASQNRRGIGIEINPVGWVYARAKLRPAAEHQVWMRLQEIQDLAPQYSAALKSLPPFFSECFSADVRRFLLAARDQLVWRQRAVDWTAMAFLLVHLHGRQGSALSNQLRQTKAMSPDYAIRWWRARELSPPAIDPLKFFHSRLRWRYAKGVARCPLSNIYLGDSSRILGRLAHNGLPQAKLLFTSPPYIGVTNYHYDQWLLGGPPRAQGMSKQKKDGHLRGKFSNRTCYESLLRSVFEKSKVLLRPDAVIYIRSDARRQTREVTTAVVREVFPEHTLRKDQAPLLGLTQTRLFGSVVPKVGEVDLILEPRGG